jgi:hypothetical protein
VTDSFGGLTSLSGLAAGSLIIGQGWILAGAVTLALMGALAIRVNWRRGKDIGDS